MGRQFQIMGIKDVELFQTRCVLSLLAMLNLLFGSNFWSLRSGFSVILCRLGIAFWVFFWVCHSSSFVKDFFKRSSKSADFRSGFSMLIFGWPFGFAHIRSGFKQVFMGRQFQMMGHTFRHCLKRFCHIRSGFKQVFMGRQFQMMGHTFRHCLKRCMPYQEWF